MWIYEIATRRLLEDSATGVKLVGIGDSGFGEHKNNPLSQHLEGLGPIPIGAYFIGESFHSPNSGDNTMRLIPLNGTNTYGRSSFEMHGYAKDHPGASSHGCVCVEPVPREKVAISHDRLLSVVSGKECAP